VGATVFANGMSIACKASSGKTTAAMPDVCLSPPSPPAGPVPIPYPNTASASDATKGSKTVQIAGEEVMLKDKSTFKTSTGNEAATKSFGMSVVTHQIQGEASFVAWSMDVKFEGENVPRHMDLMGHNEACNPTATPPWPFMDSMDPSKDPCANDKAKETTACGGKSETEACHSPDCQKARKCKLVPYGGAGSPNCCSEPAPPQSAHHLVEAHGFCKNVNGKRIPKPPFDGSNGKPGYSVDDAPCVCATSPNSNWELEHGDLHSVQGIKENFAIANAPLRSTPRDPGMAWTYGESRQAGVDAHAATYPGACEDDCIAAQLDQYHKTKLELDEDTPVYTKKYGFKKSDPDQLKRGQQLINDLEGRRLAELVEGMIG